METPPCHHDIPNAVHVSFSTWLCPKCHEDISLAYTLYCEAIREEKE